jgi:hypothetical protein
MVSVFQRRRISRWLVPADPADPRKAHGHAGLVPGRALQALEGDLQHQPVVRPGPHGADRTKPLDGVVTYERIELLQLGVSEAEIGLADRGQRPVRRPDAEGEVGVEAGALAVSTLGIHQHGVDDVRVPLPLEPGPFRPASEIGGVTALEHQPLGGGPDRRVGPQLRQRLPVVERHQRRKDQPGRVAAGDQPLQRRPPLD